MQRPGTVEHLPEFMAFVDTACKAAGVHEDAALALRLAVEEVCLNLVRYGYGEGRSGPIAVAFTVDGDAVALTISDHAPPFSPEQAPAPQLTGDLDARPIGGLGWHLVKRMMDEISYCSDPHLGNRLTLVKRAAIRQQGH